MSSNPRHQQPLPPPTRQFYRIGEISRITGLEQYVLRYWETEFPQIKADKGHSGQRLYTKKDLETILRIKELLYGEGFTIAGARKKLNAKTSRHDVEEVLETTKKELKEILNLLQ